MKLFSNSYLNEHKILKNARLGFELEFYSKLNYPLTLEVFNRKLKDINVLGFKQYHSDFKPDDKNFKLEPDLSGGFNMAEIVTGVMDYSTARIVLSQLLRIIQEIGYTTDRSSIHINISFDNGSGKQIEHINILKTILNVEEDKIYDFFPDREHNIYAKSVKNIIPFKGYDYSTSSANILQSSLNLPKTKYYGINFSTLVDGRIEFRYIGGEDYQFKINHILEMLDYFILLCWDSIGTGLNNNESLMLRKYLDSNIRRYKALSSPIKFMAEFPTVELQIDKTSNHNTLISYYSQIIDKIYDISMYTKNLKDCILNYDTQTMQLEVVYCDELEGIGLIENLSFIECTILSGDFSKCEFNDCEITSTIINASTINTCLVDETKLLNCNTDDDTVLNECFFSEGYMNSNMKGGIFRSGKIGTDAIISSETKMLNNDKNFFGFKSNVTSVQSDKKITNKGKR